MKSETILDANYRPADDEPFMNDRQSEYFRRKLLDWKADLMEDTKDTIEGMQEGRNSPTYNGGNFSPIMDNPTHEFHKWIATNLV